MTVKSMRVALGATLAVGLFAAPLAILPANAADEITAPTSEVAAQPAANAAAASPVVINEAYVNGGSAGATYKNKFVELYNNSDAAVALDGWSLQYRSASGSAAPTGVAALKGSIAAHGYYLIKGNSNATNGADLPASDADASNFSFAGGGGTLILAKKSTGFSPLGTGSVVDNSDVADLLGYSGSNTFETAVAPVPNVSKSLNRANFADTNDNSKDFTLGEATPQGTGGTGPVDPGPGNPTVQTIAEIQGEGFSSPFAGKAVTTRGVVTATYPTGGINGFYLQTPGTGGDIDYASHKASDAVFVYAKDSASQVKVGDYLEVTGNVSEYSAKKDTPTLTEISADASAVKKLDDAVVAPKAAVATLPATDAQRESLEGMLYAPSGDFTVTDNHNLNTFGEIGLAAGTKALTQPNVLFPYGSAENTALIQDNDAKSIILDDGAGIDFNPYNKPTDPLPYLTDSNLVRVGTKVNITTNVIFDQRAGSYRFQSLSQVTPSSAQPAVFSAGERPAAPAAVGGSGSGRQLQDRLVQCGELLHSHRRPRRQVRAVLGPRRQPTQR